MAVHELYRGKYYIDLYNDIFDLINESNPRLGNHMVEFVWPRVEENRIIPGSLTDRFNFRDDLEFIIERILGFYNKDTTRDYNKIVYDGIVYEGTGMIVRAHYDRKLDLDKVDIFLASYFNSL